MKTYLEKRIKFHEINYRNSNILISDNHFDKLEKNLLRIEPNCDYFNEKNKLVFPPLKRDSIDNFLKGLLPDTRLLIEPKIDGCAIALQYRDGNLEKAILRTGEDITSKIIEVKDIYNRLPIRGIFQVRGELYLPNQTRNASKKITSGLLKDKDFFDERLTFCCFQIINSRLNQHESKKHLSKLGFSVTRDIYCKFTNQVKVFSKRWLECNFFGKYPIDGIVIKINSRKLQLIREKSNLDYPYWQIAIKY